MATPVVIWGRFMEMKYSSAKTAGCVLMRGKIGRYLFEIHNCHGNHPTAYIHLPKGYPLDNILEPWWKEAYNNGDESCWLPELYDGIMLPVHGGLTYDGLSDSKRHGIVLGWDYGHCGDWCGHLDGVSTLRYEEGTPPKKWSVLEILSEVRDGVKWLERRRLKKA